MNLGFQTYRACFNTYYEYVLRHFNKNNVAHENLTFNIPTNLIGQNSAFKLNLIIH